jgi:hypothetical protein
MSKYIVVNFDAGIRLAGVLTDEDGENCVFDSMEEARVFAEENVVDFVILEC